MTRRTLGMLLLLVAGGASVPAAAPPSSAPRKEITGLFTRQEVEELARLLRGKDKGSSAEHLAKLLRATEPKGLYHITIRPVGKPPRVEIVLPPAKLGTPAPGPKRLSPEEVERIKELIRKAGQTELVPVPGGK